MPSIEVSLGNYNKLLKWKEQLEKRLEEQSGQDEEVTLDFLIGEALIAAQHLYEE